VENYTQKAANTGRNRLFASRLQYLLFALYDMAVFMCPYPHLTKLWCQIPEREGSDFRQETM
jgi:hypothetical protein